MSPHSQSTHTVSQCDKYNLFQPSHSESANDDSPQRNIFLLESIACVIESCRYAAKSLFHINCTYYTLLYIHRHTSSNNHFHIPHNHDVTMWNTWRRLLEVLASQEHLHKKHLPAHTDTYTQGDGSDHISCTLHAQLPMCFPELIFYLNQTPAWSVLDVRR